LENLQNNKLIFQILEMSLNFTKSGNVLEKNIVFEKIIRAVEENFDYRRKRVPVHGLGIRC